jgi:hypothetical protein
LNIPIKSEVIQTAVENNIDFLMLLVYIVFERLMENYFTVSLRGAKRRSNLAFKGKNEIATLPLVARNDKKYELFNILSAPVSLTKQTDTACQDKTLT